MPENLEAPRPRVDNSPLGATARRLTFIADEMVRGLEDPAYVPRANLGNLSPLMLNFLAPIVANERKRREAAKRADQLRLPPPQKLLPPPSAFQPAPEPDWEMLAHQRRMFRDPPSEVFTQAPRRSQR